MDFESAVLSSNLSTPSIYALGAYEDKPLAFNQRIVGSNPIGRTIYLLQGDELTAMRLVSNSKNLGSNPSLPAIR